MDLRTIFEYTDEDGDSLNVSEWTPSGTTEPRLVVAASSADRHPEYAAANLAASEILLDRKEALRLHRALRQWLVQEVFQEHSLLNPQPDPWGPACTRCMHKAGVHRGLGGCHAVLAGGLYCECDLDEAGASAREVSAPEKCTRCKHAEGVHTARYGCGAIDSNGECGCTEYTSAGASTPEHPDSGCTEGAQ